MIKINLTFPKNINRLTGNPFGQKIFNQQAKSKITYSEKVEIVFPDQIIMISSSFIRGFFSEMIATVGLVEVEKMVTVIAAGIDVNKIVWNNLRF